MARTYEKAYFNDKIISLDESKINIASSAVLYGLSVYTVFPIVVTKNGVAVFRLKDHYCRLVNSANIIGIDSFEKYWNFDLFLSAVKSLVEANNINKQSLVRATVHVTDLVPGTRSRGLNTILSMFIYESEPILSPNGSRLKTSVWRRVPDYAIPSRAKVNGAYVNSVLGKQDAIDSGYDDCLFLDSEGHVCELSAANIFIVRDGVLITPGTNNDILEGITRKTVIELANSMEMKVIEREIDLTEIYVAEEIFATGTSSNIAPILEVDARKIGSGNLGRLTKMIMDKYNEVLNGEDSKYLTFL